MNKQPPTIVSDCEAQVDLWHLYLGILGTGIIEVSHHEQFECILLNSFLKSQIYIFILNLQYRFIMK